MMILSLLAGCLDFFKPPNEECTPEAVEKRHLVYFKYGQEAEALACKQKLEAVTQKPYTIVPHFTGGGNDPSGMDAWEAQDGFKVVSFSECTEKATFDPSDGEKAKECADFFTRQKQNPYQAVLEGKAVKP